jgi:AcrR family transcriptional regulator
MTSTEIESSAPRNGSHRARPGGRTAQNTGKIHDAVIQLLQIGGQEAVTFQNVARRANIERSTLYRRYSSRWEMIGEAFADANVQSLDFTPTGSFRGDLTCHLTRVAHTLGSHLGMAMLAAGAVARSDPSSFAVAGGFWEARKREQEGFFRDAIARGELDPQVSMEELFAFADGPLFFRLLIIAQPIDQEWIDRTVENVCKTFCSQRR